MHIEANSVDDYIQAISGDRKTAVITLRNTIRKSLPPGYTEIFAYNMPAYAVPHSVYPAGYHVDPKIPLMLMSFASQKNFISVYHMGLYMDDALMHWFKAAYSDRVKTKLDMGKSCIRFKNPGAIPYGLIAELASKLTVNQWIALYESKLTVNPKHSKGI